MLHLSLSVITVLSQLNVCFNGFNWMGDRLRAGIPFRYVTSQLDQLSLASLRGRLIEYQLRLGVRAGISPLSGGR